ncbi:MAG: tetratricopeptide repeat protein [Acetobacteraceae bacterium]|nr:tetratricopeptide repeat protein [Acetobacteraceae bacterium]
MEGSAGWRWDKPTLVVIDYAAALASPLRTWLEILARPETQAGGRKLRVLLLERHAERDLGWWADLLRFVSFSDPATDELADPPEPVRLPSLSDVADRRALLAEAMWLAAQIAEKQPIPEPPPLGANAAFDRRLKDDAINNEPLYLMMAGVEAIQTGATAALALSRLDLADRAASRERARLRHLAAQWGLPEKLVAHVTMCVTLQGGCGAEDALTLVAKERDAMDFPQTLPPADIVNHLAEALPVPGGADIDAIRPDLIGEAFLLQGMREHHRFPKIQIGIVERAGQRAGGKVAATLIRTAQDFARGDAEHCSVAWLAHLIDRTQDGAALQALVAELPDQTLALRELAAQAQERLAGTLSEQVGAEPESLFLRAGALNNLAVRLAALGRREPALAAAEEAAALYRELAAHRPDAFRPDLALSLNNLANSLSALGRREPALVAAEEAAALYRELAARRPDAFRPNLAVSLAVQANCLDDLNRAADALTTSMEAVSNLAPAFVQHPAAFAHWMHPIVQQYLRRCDNLGRPYDTALVEPILAILQQQDAQTGEQPE